MNNEAGPNVAVTWLFFLVALPPEEFSGYPLYQRLVQPASDESTLSLNELGHNQGHYKGPLIGLALPHPSYLDGHTLWPDYSKVPAAPESGLSCPGNALMPYCSPQIKPRRDLQES